MEENYGKAEELQNKIIYVVNKSSATVHIADESPFQPSAQNVQKRQINDRQLDYNRYVVIKIGILVIKFASYLFVFHLYYLQILHFRQINIIPVSQISAKSIQDTSHMTVQQHSSVLKTFKTKPVGKSPRKQIFVVANYQRRVMSNIASLWKNGKLCDASISNGTSVVMVNILLFKTLTFRDASNIVAALDGTKDAQA